MQQQQQLKRPILMSSVEEGLSPVKKKLDKVGRKGKNETSSTVNDSIRCSSNYDNDANDLQYQQQLAA